MRSLLQNNINRHVLRILIAVLITYGLYHYVYQGSLLIMLISTVFVMLTTIGSSFFQGLTRFFILIIVVGLVSIFFSYPEGFYTDASTIMLGSCVGILANTFILPDKIELEFKNSVIPLLEASRIYFAKIIECLVYEKALQKNELEEAKKMVEKKLLCLPVWIYNTGLDITLQKGYRYYFMQLNHLVEILFAMHYVVTFSYEKEWILNIEKLLNECNQSVTEFIQAILKLFDQEKLKEGVNDFEENINEMSRLIHNMVPIPFELLNNYHNVKYLSEFLHNLHELRLVLIQLAKALR